LESILHFDEWLFSLLNGAWRSDILDTIAPIWRNKYFWIPLYLFILATVAINFKKQFIPFLLCAVITVSIADTLSSKIIKPLVKRDRPCRNEALATPATVLINCGGGYSFTSSHATNHFAIACFFLLTIGSILTYTKGIFLVWAATISYCQVYVGVHYPIDIMVGAMIGSCIGLAVAFFFNRRWALQLNTSEAVA